MFCYCKPALPLIIALVTLCTFTNLKLLQPNCHHVVVQALQQPSTITATIDRHELSEHAINITTATTEQICSTRMLKNASLCKPCTCDPIGSKLPNCDQLTRRCTCKLGYMGNNCSKCSYGFLNSTSQLDLKTTAAISNSSLNRWQCESCGPCFDSWQENLSPLKQQAIYLIKRASDLEGLFLGHLGLDPKTDKLVFGSNFTGILDTLDANVHTIGERVLENKQASDQINILSSELNSTVIAINEIDSEIANQTLESEQVETKLKNLNYAMSLQSDTQNHLTKTLQGYKEELLDIQEFIPEGAIRLVKSNRNRTRKALGRILEHDRKFAPILNSSLANLEQILDRVKYSKRQMKYIGSQILNDTLKTHPIVPMDLHHDPVAHQHHSSSQPARFDGPARAIAELDMQLFDSYQANFENRTSEIGETRKQIEDAKGALLQASNLMTAFEANLTAVNQTVSSLNGPGGGGGCEFEQLVENATQIVRASLDKIDVRWPVAKAELADLTAKVQSVNATTRQLFSNISSELNSALRENLPNLVAFREANLEAYNLSDVGSMRNRTELLASNLTDLSVKLNKLVDLKQVALNLHNQTKLLNAYVTSEQVNAVIAEATSDISSVSKTLTADSKSALERVRSYQSESFGRKMMSDWVLTDRINKLTNSTAENLQLTQQVSDRVAELSTGLLIANGLANTTSDTNVTRNSTRLSKLHDKRRMTNLVNDLRHISMFLHKGLMQSRNLSAEFDDFELTFAGQIEMIDSLHREMDAINIDLKRKSDYYENCPTVLDKR